MTTPSLFDIDAAVADIRSKAATPETGQEASSVAMRSQLYEAMATHESAILTDGYEGRSRSSRRSQPHPSQSTDRSLAGSDEGTPATPATPDAFVAQEDIKERKEKYYAYNDLLRSEEAPICRSEDTPATVATVATEGQKPQKSAILAVMSLWLRGCYRGYASERAVRDFLISHWEAAYDAGWSDVELFSCHPDPEYAAVRWDCMGAVTLAALAGDPIVEVHQSLIRYASGLTFRRRERAPQAPIWDVFPMIEGLERC